MIAIALDIVNLSLVVFLLYLLFRIAKERKGGKKVSEVKNLIVSFVIVVILLWTFSFIHGFCNNDNKEWAKPTPEMVKK